MPSISQPGFDDPATLFDNPRPIATLASDYPRGHRIAAHRHARAQLVHDPANFMRTLALPEKVALRSPTTLREKRVPRF